MKLTTILKHTGNSDSHYDIWISEKKKGGYLIFVSIRYLIHHHKENVWIRNGSIL